MTKRVEPVRTCVGCRVRIAKSHLLRVVAVDGALLPDPRGTVAGRGAYLHPVPECLALAERRRAFRKALRLDGMPDLDALQAYVARLASPTDRAEPDDERSMSQHR